MRLKLLRYHLRKHMHHSEFKRKASWRILSRLHYRDYSLKIIFGHDLYAKTYVKKSFFSSFTFATNLQIEFSDSYLILKIFELVSIAQFFSGRNKYKNKFN